MQRNAKDQPSADAQGTAEQGEPASRWLIPEAGSPEYWRKVLADPGAHGYTAENAQRLAASFTGPRTERSAEEAAYRLLGWFDKMLSAAHWFGLKNVAPIEAAMLLCQFNPSTNGFDVAERMTNDETNPQNLIELRRRLEDLAQSEPRARSLRDWLGIAKELKLRHHSWIDQYLAAVEIVAKGQPGGPRGDADKPANREPVPAPLTTENMASCFGGLNRWDEANWKKRLGNKPNWIGMPETPGQRGGDSATWNPVTVGAALVSKGKVRVNSVRAKFQTVHLLKPWADRWKTYEAEFLADE